MDSQILIYKMVLEILVLKKVLNLWICRHLKVRLVLKLEIILVLFLMQLCIVEMVVINNVLMLYKLTWLQIIIKFHFIKLSVYQLKDEDQVKNLKLLKLRYMILKLINQIVLSLILQVINLLLLVEKHWLVLLRILYIEWLESQNKLLYILYMMSFLMQIHKEQMMQYSIQQIQVMYIESLVEIH